MKEYLTRRNAIRILLLTIFAVVARMIWDVHACLNSNGQWNPKTQVCELKSTKQVNQAKPN